MNQSAPLRLPGRLPRVDSRVGTRVGSQRRHSPDPSPITPAARARHVQAYAPDAALTAGFNGYRTLGGDATDNREASRHVTVHTPVLYLRVDKEPARSRTTATASPPLASAPASLRWCQGPATLPGKMPRRRCGD